jgi:hypothetical protein
MTDTDIETENALANSAAVEAGLAEQAAEAEAAERKRIVAEARDIAFDFLFVQGLYVSLDRTTPVGGAAENNICYGAFGFDAYCTSCKRETTFRVAAKEITARGMKHPSGATTPIAPRCSRHLSKRLDGIHLYSPIHRREDDEDWTVAFLGRHRLW